MNFDAIDLLASLDAADNAALDAQDFGIVTMDHEGTVLAYNRAESALAGLGPAQVIGRHFFSQVAPCTNNYLVAQRYEEPALDDSLDYVFTLRMRPTKVRLRLLKGAARQYLVVQRA